MSARNWVWASSDIRAASARAPVNRRLCFLLRATQVCVCLLMRFVQQTLSFCSRLLHCLLGCSDGALPNLADLSGRRLRHGAGVGAGQGRAAAACALASCCSTRVAFSFARRRRSCSSSTPSATAAMNSSTSAGSYPRTLAPKVTSCITDSEAIIPRDDHSKANFDRWDRFEGPQVGRPHQLFYHKLRPDHEGKAHIMLAGMPDYAEGPIAVYLSFTHDTLPWFTNWKSMIAGDYVTGIEPSNAWVEGRAAEREAGRLRFLEAWEAVEYEVQFGVLAGLQAINEYAEAHGLPRLNRDLS